MKYDEILNVITNTVIIDSHEHLPHERDFQATTIDIIDLLVPYVCDSLSCAGMQLELWQRATNKTINFAERWNLLLPYIDRISMTTNYQYLIRSVQDSLGIKLCNENLDRINSMLACPKSQVMHNIFKINKIEKALTFVGYEKIDYFDDSNLLVAVPTVSYITPHNQEQIQYLNTVTGINIRDLHSLDAAIAVLFETYRLSKIRNIKIGSAYNRVLDFQPSNHQLAAEQLQSIIDGYIVDNEHYGEINTNIPSAPISSLDDYVINKCIELAALQSMTVIIHTGFHAWGRNNIEAMRASYLTKIIANNPNTKFVLLHAGYPFVDEVIALARYYGNVYVDLCWLHILDRAAAQATIIKAIETLPINKIIAFGGDCCTPYNTIGHLTIARENIAMALSQLSKQGIIVDKDIRRIIQDWLYNNPKLIYQC